jgi:hypothetical protein
MNNFADTFRRYFNLDVMRTFMFTVPANSTPPRRDQFEDIRAKHLSRKSEALDINRAHAVAFAKLIKMAKDHQMIIVVHCVTSARSFFYLQLTTCIRTTNVTAESSAVSQQALLQRIRLWKDMQMKRAARTAPFAINDAVLGGVMEKRELKLTGGGTSSIAAAGASGGGY